MNIRNAHLKTGLFFLITISLTWVFPGCSHHTQEAEETSGGFDMMADYIEKHTDFVNSAQAPGVIGVDAVLNYTGNKMHLIDLRPNSEFEEGHIAGAVNVSMDKLLPYLETRIEPGHFDTIALVSTDGADAVFATTLLRILGYNNIFAVRLGMGWHKKFARKAWGSHLSSEYESKLSVDSSPVRQSYDYPVIKTITTDPYTLIRTRVMELLSSGYKTFQISAKEVFEATDSFYIINYWPQSDYQVGHIPGAFQYDPRNSLSRKTGLSTLPPQRPIVIYCHQSNLSSSAAAYLLLLGYNVRSLSYGTNSFMYNLHKEKIGKNYFDPKAVFDYPLEDKSTQQGNSNALPVLVEVKSQGGC